MTATALIKIPYSMLHDGASLLRARYSLAQKRSILLGYTKLHFFLMIKGARKPITTSLCGMKISAFSIGSLVFLFREIFMKGEYNFDTANSTPTILDCGANIGLATLFFKWKFPQGLIEAFEPDPKTFALLKKNIEQNSCAGVTLHNTALGKEDGVNTLYANSKDPGSLIMSIGLKRREGTHTEVATERLSRYMQKPIDFLKLDVEGSEHAVLEDLESEGALANVQQMMLEYHHKIGNEDSRMSSTLATIEKAGFEYQLECTNIIPIQKNIYQDILVYCYRK